MCYRNNLHDFYLKKKTLVGHGVIYLNQNTWQTKIDGYL